MPEKLADVSRQRLTGSTEAPKKPEEFGPEEHVKAVLFDIRACRPIKDFLRSLNQQNLTILDSELSLAGEEIPSLSFAQEELVPVLQELLETKDPSRKKELRKQLKNDLEKITTPE